MNQKLIFLFTLVFAATTKSITAMNQDSILAIQYRLKNKIENAKIPYSQEELKSINDDIIAINQALNKITLKPRTPLSAAHHAFYDNIRKNGCGHGKPRPTPRRHYTESKITAKPKQYSSETIIPAWQESLVHGFE